MKLKFIKRDDFVNYKKCSMFLGTTSCDRKCCKENNLPCSTCQNYPWSNNSIKQFKDEIIIDMYLKDGLEESIVLGGLEPMLQFQELISFIDKFRKVSEDDIVIYTGYYKTELEKEIEILKKYKNIIIKFGRYIPNRKSKIDLTYPKFETNMKLTDSSPTNHIKLIHFFNNHYSRLLL